MYFVHKGREMKRRCRRRSGCSPVQPHTGDAFRKLDVQEIDALIADCTFHEVKARTIHEIARRAHDEFGGVLPCDAEVLQTFHGVGPKCAHLVVGIASGQPLISVDAHDFIA